MSTNSSDNAAMNSPSTAHRVRVTIFRVAAALAGLFFVVARGAYGVGAVGAAAA